MRRDGELNAKTLESPSITRRWQVNSSRPQIGMLAALMVAGVVWLVGVGCSNARGLDQPTGGAE